MSAAQAVLRPAPASNTFVFAAPKATSGRLNAKRAFVNTVKGSVFFEPVEETASSATDLAPLNITRMILLSREPCCQELGFVLSASETCALI